MIAMPTYERWSNTSKLQRFSKHVSKKYQNQDWSSDSFVEDGGIYDTIRY